MRRRPFLAFTLIALAPLTLALGCRDDAGTDTRRLVEIRTYDLKPGTRLAFDSLVFAVLPLLRQHDIDVVTFGASDHDSTSFYLIRAFDDAQDRDRKEERFYGSAEWRDGPRDSVLAMIERYTTVVLTLDGATIEGLRRGGR
jgi:hypothetical protein